MSVQSGEKFIFGNYRSETVVLPDLEIGPESARQALKLDPGEVYNLLDFFPEEVLRRSFSLKIAVRDGLLKPCASVDEKIDVVKQVLGQGIAPPNEFDRRLREELIKEKKEEEQLKASVDMLASRIGPI